MLQYSLSALLEIADKGFKSLFGGFDFWGTAEILKITVKGKYAYLELVEYDETGKIVAKVKGCIFDDTICQKFLRETKLESLYALTGMKILFHGRFSFHKEYHFSVIIDELSAEYTLGHLQKKQDDITKELEKLGIAYKNKQTAFGYPPFTIAVISAEGAAGLKDFYTVIAQAGYAVQYKCYFCAMHGNNAIEGVHEQLQRINDDMNEGEKIDAVAIIRGGGESSGIAWQNDINIAKKICLMPVPVIVAIGHTQDKFVLQDLAWYGAKTPTDAAYKIVALLELWEESIEAIYDAIVTSSEDKILTMRANIDDWNRDITLTLTRFLRHTRVTIDARYGTIMAISPTKMLKSGYALLQKNGAYLGAQEIANLQADDTLEMQVYDKEFEIKIIRKK